MLDVKIAYFEMVGGASGNMLLGSLVDCGLDLSEVERIVRSIKTGAWTFRVERTIRLGIAATLVTVETAGDDEPEHIDIHGVHLVDVLRCLDESELTQRQKIGATSIYKRLAEAEAKVHGSTIDDVHFHEVGATDAIVDVASFVVGLDVLGIEEIYCSKFPIGNGPIRMHHGLYPNPPPATAQMLLGHPVFDTDVEGEMVTTTAAAILTTLVHKPGHRPSLRPTAIGYGAGHKEFTVPNVTRVVVGELSEGRIYERGEGVILEANIDDMSPQDYSYAIEMLFKAGAWDVWTTPISMKKARPATMLSVLVSEENREQCSEIMLLHTTTIGLRSYHVDKMSLQRAIVTIETEFGPVRVKQVTIGERIRSVPEFEDVLEIARRTGEPLWKIRALVNGKIATQW